MKAHFLAVALAVVLLSGVSHGDPIYAVTGSLSITGNNVCGGPCVETLDFSFEIGYAIGPHSQFYPFFLPGTTAVTSFGPLGTFNLPYVGDPNFIGFLNNAKDEIDLDFPDAEGRVTPGPPIISGSWLYWCQSDICGKDFAPNSLPGQLSPHLVGTVQANVVQVPEGSEMAMLGITAIGIMAGLKKKLLVT